MTAARRPIDIVQGGLMRVRIMVNGVLRRGDKTQTHTHIEAGGRTHTRAKTLLCEHSLATGGRKSEVSEFTFLADARRRTRRPLVVCRHTLAGRLLKPDNHHQYSHSVSTNCRSANFNLKFYTCIFLNPLCKSIIFKTPLIPQNSRVRSNNNLWL